MLLLPLIFFAVLVGVDQAAKYFAITVLKPLGSINIIEGFFSLTYVENRGAAFGIMQGGKWIFIILTVAVCIACVIYYSKLAAENRLMIVRAAIILVCSGAVGNMIDRLFRGYVVDMLDFNIFGYNFPVFNFADICVCVGAFLLVIGVMFFDRSKEDK